MPRGCGLDQVDRVRSSYHRLHEKNDDDSKHHGSQRSEMANESLVAGKGLVFDQSRMLYR
jgi:hypothetical protein